MWAKLQRFNTMRNQILVVYLLVMAIVLVLIGLITFKQVSSLVSSNAEKQIQQTAVQANGRMETLYNQLELLTRQVVTNPSVQNMLLDIVEGGKPTYKEKQSLLQMVNSYQAYYNGIDSLELYLNNHSKLYPADDRNLQDRLGRKWIEKAKRGKGEMLWVGTDPKNPRYFLAIRRVSLFDRWFSSGGYLLVRINKNYFGFEDTPITKNLSDYTILVDGNNKTVHSNYDGAIVELLSMKEPFVKLDSRKFMLVRQESAVTGWTMLILTPVDVLTEGVSVLRTSLFLSGAIGFVIFLVFSFFLSTLITKPIFKLITAMRRAREGELVHSPEMASTVEINELNDTYNQMVDQTNHLIQMVYEKEIITSRTELKALQAQINPHFLYNTLNALYWSLDDKGEEELAEMVVAMSELFRYTINGSNKNEWVSIREEFDHIEKYLQIMKIRFGERLEWELCAPEHYLGVKIPKLLIQPLVENAILHGIGNKAGKGKVKVSIEKAPDSSSLVIKVEDNGPGMDQATLRRIVDSMESGGVSSLKGTGMAVANVNRRLKLYYDNQDLGLSIYSILTQGTWIVFEVPGEES
ncbi:sensor histidine kinase [Mesobacillus foraminis]|uniref:sensor histidine kinase n=1 Tax=Mesobacillus foraminis TaxID=279826 RepID=UPI0039A24C11